MECGVRSVKCAVWSVKSGVSSEECKVWSVFVFILRLFFRWEEITQAHGSLEALVH